MSGDFTRFTFDPLNDFSRVRAQQGRVLLDADLNEIVDGIDHRLRALALDVLGPCTAPRDLSTDPASATGFRIEPAGTSFTIGLGRLYVHGLELDNHGQIDTPAYLEPGLRDERGTKPVDYLHQPYFPDPPHVPAGRHVVYVDAWDREVTAVEDPDLVDSAIGVDTSARMQTVWQVKVLAGDDAAVTCATPDDKVQGWRQATAPSAGRLTTAAAAIPAGDDPCTVPPDSGYLGWDNRLYRVEVHHAGPMSGATFKWSRDNASVATAVLAVDSTRTVLTVASTGHDDVQTFTETSWVEVLDDHHELSGKPGFMATVAMIDPVDSMTQRVTLSAPLPADFVPADSTRRTRIRRWDQLVGVGADGTIKASATSGGLVLEDGVQVTLSTVSGGRFRTGDYWTFTARSADGQVQTLDQAPPQGPIHFYGRLAVIDLPHGVEDCRGLWPPVCDDEGDCACTVCVTPRSHETGQRTLQMAVSEVGRRGGTVCLEPGRYVLERPLFVEGAMSLTIKGSGWSSLLLYRGEGPAVVVSRGREVRIEDVTIVVDSAAREAPSSQGSGSKPVIIDKGPSAARDRRVSLDEQVTLLKGVRDESVGVVGLLATMTIGLQLSRCFIVDIGLAELARQTTAASGTSSAAAASYWWPAGANRVGHSTGIALTGLVGALSVRDCVVVAGVGVSAPYDGPSISRVYSHLDVVADTTTVTDTGIRDYALLAGLEIDRCIILGLLEAMVTTGMTLVAGAADVTGSVLAGYASTGVVHAAHPMNATTSFDRCTIVGRATGLLVRSSLTSVSGSRLIAAAATGRSCGLRIDALGAKGAVEHVELVGSQVSGSGSAVGLSGECVDVVVRGNQLVGGQLGGVAMTGDATGRRIVVRDNDLALTTVVVTDDQSTESDNLPSMRGGIWLRTATDSEISNNRLHDLAGETDVLTAGVLAEDCVSVVISGNQISGLETARGEVAGIGVWPSAYRLDITDNTVSIDSLTEDRATVLSRRYGISVQSLDRDQQWSALTERARGVENVDRKESQPRAFGSPFDVNSTATYAVVSDEFVRYDETGLVIRYLLPVPAVTVRGNRVDLQGPGIGIDAEVDGPLILSDNRVAQWGTDEVDLGRGVRCMADSLVASANHLTSSAEAMTVDCDPSRLSVVGNVTSSTIQVAGSPIDAPWNALNTVIN